MATRNAYCSYCGQAFAPNQPWPRTCQHCAQTSFLNPLPVTVVLIPVEGGLVTVRRSVAPHEGMLALPGGFIGVGELWQAAGAREVFEETGIMLDPGEIHDFRVLSAPDGTVLIFGLASPRQADQLPAFAPNSEASARVIIDEPAELAFPLHTQIVAAFFHRTQG